MRSFGSMVLLHAVLALQVSSKTPVVDIFYESQCPYSLEFLNTTLREAFEDKEFWNSMEVKLHPWGNARAYPENIISEGYHFWHPEATYPLVKCQHGEEECLGNRIQACAIALNPKTEVHVPFIICMASYGLRAGTELTSYACAQKHGIDIKALKECGGEGSGDVGGDGGKDRSHDLMMAIMKTSQAAQVNEVPWVNVNDVQTVNGTLVEPVCHAIDGHKPHVCKGLEASSTGGTIHEEKEHCGGSGAGFLSRRVGKVRPCGSKKSIAIRVPAPWTTEVKELI